MEPSSAPRFSIVVPAYNVAPYLASCLDSLIAQGGGDFEIILVNDSSTDETGAIADRFAEQYTCLRVIHAPVNAGVSAARNRALDAARGKYVVFVDGDDRLLEGALSGVRSHLELHGDADILVCRFVSECGVLNNDFVFAPEIIDTRDPEEFLGFVIESGYHVDHCWNYIVKRSLIVENGARFVHAVIGEDAEFIVGLLYRAKSISLYPGDFYWYRIRDDSLKNSKGIAQTACFVTNALEMFGSIDVRHRFVLTQIRHTIGIFLARLCLAEERDVPQIAGALAINDLRAVGYLLPGFGLAAGQRNRDEILKALIQVKATISETILAILPSGKSRRLFIYCAGPIGEAVLSTLQRANHQVEAVLDDNESLTGRSILDVKIHPSKLLRQMPRAELNELFVIVCTQKTGTFEKISKSLIGIGLTPEQIAPWMF
jgi:glycosyltransferase involved in cell wall biosynthesis